jgi:hypothetical protein
VNVWRKLARSCVSEHNKRHSTGWATCVRVWGEGLCVDVWKLARLVQARNAVLLRLGGASGVFGNGRNVITNVGGNWRVVRARNANQRSVMVGLWTMWRKLARNCSRCLARAPLRH